MQTAQVGIIFFRECHISSKMCLGLLSLLCNPEHCVSCKYWEIILLCNWGTATGIQKSQTVLSTDILCEQKKETSPLHALFPHAQRRNNDTIPCDKCLQMHEERCEVLSRIMTLYNFMVQIASNCTNTGSVPTKGRSLALSYTTLYPTLLM